MQDLWPEDELLGDQENLEFVKPFSEEEIKLALFQIEKIRLQTLMEFYQRNWNILKSDLGALFQDFHKGEMDIRRLNYVTITLLPKVKEASRVQQYRPICLLNCLYKWFTKVLTIQLEVVAMRLIHRNQIAFLSGRNIMINVLALHEILHETKRRGEVGIVVKLDFEKAYDMVNWAFLLGCMEVRRFSNTSCEWISKVLKGGTVAVRLNEQIGPYFQSCQGVRQGDLLSPLLFNFVVDCPTRMVIKAQENMLITSLISHMIPNGVAILQYADDTIVCLENNLEGARNMKLFLYLYEQMAGLKIN
jgi:hypothetical protein